MNTQIRKHFFVSLLLLISLLISACATTQETSQSPNQIPVQLYDEEYLGRIYNINSRLCPAINYPCQHLRIIVYDTDDVNAFITPIALITTKGLLDEFTDIDLTFVLAHELAHAKLGHINKKLFLSKFISTLLQILDKAYAGVGYLDLIANPLITRAYSREQEIEADTLSAKTLKEKLHISQKAALRVLNRLKEISLNKRDSEGGGIFGTHPTMTARIENIQQMYPEEPFFVTLAHKIVASEDEANHITEFEQLRTYRKGELKSDLETKITALAEGDITIIKYHDKFQVIKVIKKY